MSLPSAPVGPFVSPHGTSNVLRPSSRTSNARSKAAHRQKRKGYIASLEEKVERLRVILTEIDPVVRNTTYNVTNHIRGTVNNIHDIQNATFHDNRSSLSPRSTEHIFPTYSSASQKGARPSPLRSFIIFGLTFLKARLGADAAHLTDSSAIPTITETWGKLSPEDRRIIEKQSDRSEELHFAMLGGDGRGVKGEKQDAKYLSFTSRMIDVWAAKWVCVQEKAKRHAVALGGALLGALGHVWPAPCGGGGPAGGDARGGRSGHYGHGSESIVTEMMPTGLFRTPAYLGLLRR